MYVYGLGSKIIIWASLWNFAIAIEVNPRFPPTSRTSGGVEDPLLISSLNLYPPPSLNSHLSLGMESSSLWDVSRTFSDNTLSKITSCASAIALAMFVGPIRASPSDFSESGKTNTELWRVSASEWLPVDRVFKASSAPFIEEISSFRAELLAAVFFIASSTNSIVESFTAASVFTASTDTQFLTLRTVKQTTNTTAGIAHDPCVFFFTEDFIAKLFIFLWRSTW
mmetsp:Transcript_1956/g.3516  ORF Transcript_1956/g.3516 Transcript_1956/m.3516 type:complete len:225 (-) Transcript_1956:185-859(-)